VQRMCEWRLAVSPEEVTEQGGASCNACDWGAQILDIKLFS
jgi:hypothetical protein